MRFQFVQACTPEELVRKLAEEVDLSGTPEFHYNVTSMAGVIPYSVLIITRQEARYGSTQ